MTIHCILIGSLSRNYRINAKQPSRSSLAVRVETFPTVTCSLIKKEAQTTEFSLSSHLLKIGDLVTLKQRGHLTIGIIQGTKKKRYRVELSQAS